LKSQPKRSNRSPFELFRANRSHRSVQTVQRSVLRLNRSVHRSNRSVQTVQHSTGVVVHFRVCTHINKIFWDYCPSCLNFNTRFTYPMQFSGSFTQSMLHRKRSQEFQPMGGVRPRPLSRAWVMDAHANRRTIALILKQEYIIFSKMD
jgi:hypothetical protein